MYPSMVQLCIATGIFLFILLLLPSHSPSLTPCREGKMETHTEPPHKNTLLTDLERMDAGGIEETEVHCQRGISQP